MADIASRLRAERARAGLSLRELATAASLSKAYLSNLENARVTNPSVDVAERIAAALGLTLAGFLSQPDDDFADIAAALGGTAAWLGPGRRAVWIDEPRARKLAASLDGAASKETDR